MKKLISVFILLCIAAITISAKPKLNIVFIGNSITQGVLLPNNINDAPTFQAVEFIKCKKVFSVVNYFNAGVSGQTTVDFLPSTQKYFKKVIEGADKFVNETDAQLLFSVMLGTNDSAEKGPTGAPVSKKQYKVNMKAIIDELLAKYPNCMVVLNRPIWYSPNTYNSATYLKAGLERLISYTSILNELIDEYALNQPNKVFSGDFNAFSFFEKNYEKMLLPENGNAGTFYLHPNKEGARKLGEFWAKAIIKAYEEKVNSIN